MSARRDGPRFPHPVLAVLAGLGVALVTVPLAGLLLDAPWSRVAEVLSRRGSLDALRLSIVIPLASAVLAVAVGVPVGRLVASEFRGRSLVRSLVLLPIVLPPVVGGVALLAALGPDGVLGPALSSVGIDLPGTPAAAVLAGAFVSFPLVVLAVEGGFRSFDPRLVEAGETLGASRWYSFRRIAVPTLWPQFVGGATLAWARALGEFGATATFAGTVEGRTQTLPLAIYAVKDADAGAALVLSLLLVAVSAVVLAIPRARGRRP